MNIHQSKAEIQGKLKIKIKNPTKNEKKKFERERERERNNLFLYGKNMHRMGESEKFIVR